jgi:hypothetical protein
MNNIRILSIVSLIVIITSLIGVYIAYGEQSDPQKEHLTFLWDPVDGMTGYKVFVITYYDRKDRSLATERIYDVGNVTSVRLPVYRTSDQVDTAVINVCFAVMGYNDSHQTARSEEECARPWPVENIQVID